MRDIVDACYKHHRCPFLLTYSKELSDNSPESLRFVNNNNSTTSLYNRISKKLLLTFRNENMVSVVQLRTGKALQVSTY